jgi:hypothetical protein
LLPADLDPGQLRLMAFALMTYPRMLPQITRMTTGMTPEDPHFVDRWEALCVKSDRGLRPPRAAKASAPPASTQHRAAP